MYSTRVIESTDDLPTSQWNYVVSNSDYSTVYHDIGYLKAVETGLGKQAAHIVAYINDNPVGLLPNFITPVGKGTPFYRLVSLQPGSGGVVLTGDELSVLEALMEGVDGYEGKMLVAHTIRAQTPGHLLIDRYLQDRGYRSGLGSEFELDLRQGWEAIEERMSKDRRYDLRKAREQSYQVMDIDITPSTIADFYDLYISKMREIGAAIKPEAFFQTLAQELSGKLKLFSVEVEGELRGYHLYLLDEYQSKLRHQYMAILRDDFEHYPGEILHEHVIKWGIVNGFQFYGFGGGKADLRSGTSRYKRQFGGKLTPFIYWEKEFSKIFKLGRFVFKRIQQ